MRRIIYTNDKYENGHRKRYLQGCTFPSMFKIMEMELRPDSPKRYPMPIKCNLEEFMYNDEKRLQWRLEEFSEWRYDEDRDWILCYIVQEIPMYYLTRPGKYIQERIYRHSILLGGVYCDMWADEDNTNGIYEWSACEGEDEVIANNFAELHICTEGEIVQVVKDDSLTLGIVVDYCHSGFYDMWVWDENQGCSRERIPVSRVLYGLYFADETEIPDEEIRKELKKKLL